MPAKPGPAQRASKRIRDARYRLNNCGRVQARVREWLRANKPQRVLKSLQQTAAEY